MIKRLLFIAVIVIGVGLTAGCNKQSGNSSSEKSADQAAGDQVALGEAIAKEWQCSYCHSPEAAGPDGKPMPDPERLYMGHPADEPVPEIPEMILTSPEYMEFLDNLDTTVWATDNRIVFTANLTPDDETGIGTWTEEQFIATIRSGQHRGIGKRLKYPMPWQELAELDDEELAALFAFLRTQKPISNKVPESIVLFR